MNPICIDARFDELLDPLGNNAANFFLAASLYFSHKISFNAAALLAELSFNDFNARLKEHFGKGYLIFDEDVIDDITLIEKL